MPQRIFIGVAWPYANSSLHLGHVAGTFLPADIFARYHRMKGNDVLMVSGSDQHGTPVTVTAEEAGKSPKEIVESQQPEFLDCLSRLGITFDLFTSTGTDNHRDTAHEVFLKLLQRGYLYQQTMSMPYSLVDKRFLPDRYVEGTCPHCGYDAARGDQCDSCGKPMDAKDLINIRSRLHGDMPEFRDTTHFFLKLSAFEEALTTWVEAQEHWRPNVRNFTLAYLRDGLRDRAITRDLEWGVPVPHDGFENKRLYVWFEAVIGYLSASREWAQRQGDPDAWRSFWQGDVRSYYFIGKDNIPFHTIIWPAMLMGYDQDLKLPYDVPANEFLNLAGLKFSKSRNWAIWLPDYLDRFEADPLRYALSINMPETSDSDFTWQEFLRRNNDELVATYGNLVNRVLSFTYRSFDGLVPQPPNDLDESSRELLEHMERTFAEVGGSISGCRFSEAIRNGMGLARAANRYLEAQAPWKTIKTDKQAAAQALWVGCYIVSALKTIFYPFLPTSSQRVHEYLGLAGEIEQAGWSIARPEPGHPLVKPRPLFEKLDPETVTQEMSAIGA